MLVDANCDNSVTIPRCPNLVVNLKVSVALKKILALTSAFWAPPYFKSWIHPWPGGGACKFKKSMTCFQAASNRDSARGVARSSRKNCGLKLGRGSALKMHGNLFACLGGHLGR